MARRRVTVRLTPEQRRLFEEPNFGYLATVSLDGTPHVTPVWVDLEGERVVVNTAEGRVKHRNVAREGRAPGEQRVKILVYPERIATMGL